MLSCKAAHILDFGIQMGVYGQLHAPAAYSPAERALDAQWTTGRVSLRTRPEATKRKTPVPVGGRIPVDQISTDKREEKMRGNKKGEEK
jgi:hypothetical protein